MMETLGPDISVCIGYKDWGQDRLRSCIASLMNSFGDFRGEVIVSDYGSTSEDAAAIAHEEGAQYIYTATDGTWSRSRALNAGFANAEGQVFVSTDADMVFTPNSMQRIGQRILDDEQLAIVLQCRDLSPQWTPEMLQDPNLDWHAVAIGSRLRPRWGMGGMFAVHRDVYRLVRGFDERMQIYGGEDLDFANRVRRAGARLEWLEERSVRMYHIWHPSSRVTAANTTAGTAAIEANRAIYREDPTLHRNTNMWRHPIRDTNPLVSVVICTYNRAEYLRDSIESVQWQSFQDFEIIIVDDGSEDNTPSLVAELKTGDDRIRYFQRNHAGIASARNFGNSMARGRYIVIHDSDDLMTPRRLEWQLAAIQGSTVGSYGAWADFDNATGELSLNTGKAASSAAVLLAGKVIVHASLMVRRDLAQQIPYDESFKSGSDYNWVTRLLRSGAELVHTGHVHIMRRLHTKQVTVSDASAQKSAALQTSFAVSQSLLDGNDRDTLARKYRALPAMPVEEYEVPQSLLKSFLPDHLAKNRHVVVEISDENATPPDSEALGEYIDHRNKKRLVTYQNATMHTLANVSVAGGRWQNINSHASPLAQLLEMLHDSGHHFAAIAWNGKHALNAIFTWISNAPDGARIDVGLPPHDGFSMLSQMYADMAPGTRLDALAMLSSTDGELGLRNFLRGSNN